MLCLAYKSGVYKQFQSQIGAGLNLAALCTDHTPPQKKWYHYIHVDQKWLNEFAWTWNITDTLFTCTGIY